MNLEDCEVVELLQNFEVGKPFESMKGFDTQIECMKNHFKYTEPEEIPLGKRIEQRFNKKTGKYEPVHVHETMQHVSLIETLKLINSNKEVREYVQSEKASSDDTIASYKDGESFKENPFFQQHPTAYRIQLYQDDLVVNNPLGSKVHAHKISAIYYVLQNLPPYLNSFLGGIHVLNLAYSADVAKYGFKKILGPFLLELEQLESENGVEYEDKNGTSFTLRASLALTTGDGLAIHQLFGLLGPAARYFCRQCMISRQELKDNIQNEFTPRTPQLYEEQLRKVSENPAATTETGVRENSPLNASKYFHCCKNYTFDPMHDILEGVGQLDLELVVSHFVFNDNYNLTVDELNARINLFDYGKAEIKNKPSSSFSAASLKNLKDNTISQKAAQTWCLLRVFPFLVSDKVPADDEYLSLILLLNRINEFVFAPKLKRSILAEFHELILEHNRLFHRLFSNQTDAINKLHHITHYAECIKMSGPLRHLSCFLFENRHNLFKKRGSTMGNFKNAPKTLIKSAQMCQTATWGMNTNPREKFKCVHGKQMLVANTESKDFLLEKGYQLEETVLNITNVEVYGMKYKKNVMVAVDSGVPDLEGYPVFGVIEEIVADKDDKLYLLCKEWNSLRIEESWEVEEGCDYRFINVDDLCDTKPFSLWRDYKTDLSYISLRFKLF